MKNIILHAIILFLVVSVHITASAQYEWSWAITEGGPYTEYITSITYGPGGNIYATGVFDDTLVFFGETIISRGDHDVFVASFTSEGNLNWVRCGGSELEDSPRDIQTDNQYVYVTGGFQNEAVFDNKTIVSGGLEDVFVLKYDLAGTLQWAINGGSPHRDYGHAIATDNNGNIYLTGSIRNPATFGNYFVPHMGYTDIFIAKYDGDGTCQWAQGAGGQIWDYASSIVVKDNHVFICGGFNDVGHFDTISVTSIEYNDIFIAHYLTDGSVIEVATAGGSGNDVAECMALDNDMNLYIGGAFLLDLTIGNNSFNSVSQTMDMFLTKFEPGNGFIWAKHFGAGGIDEIVDIYCDGNEHFVFAGHFENTIDFGSLELTSEGNNDAGFVKCTFGGEIECVCQIGGSGGVTVADFVGDGSGHYYAGGSFLDELRIGDFTFIPAGVHDLFLANLAESTGIDDEMEMGPGFRVYPNPAVDVITIRYRIPDAGYRIMSIVDISGRVVWSSSGEELTPGKYETGIDVSDVPAGIYFLRLQIGNETVVRKLIKLEL